MHMCLCRHVGSCAHVHMPIWTCTCGYQSTTSSVAPQSYHLVLWDWVSNCFRTPGLGHQDLPVSSGPILLSHTHTHAHIKIFTGFWRSNSRLPAFTASSFPNKLPSQFWTTYLRRFYPIHILYYLIVIALTKTSDSYCLYKNQCLRNSRTW